MDVTHFNSYLRGGAATAARRLHRALIERGVSSRFQYLEGQRSSDSQSELAETAHFETEWLREGVVAETAAAVRYRIHRQLFKRETAGRAEGTEIFTSPRGRPKTKWKSTSSARQSIVHLHWVSKFIDYPSFFRSLQPNQPVVWTLHDMNAFTGGCHFSGSCEQFKSGCGNCPQLKQPHRHDVSHRSFQIKQSSLGTTALHVVAPSRWLIDQARQSPILANANSFQRIPYGVPLDDLFPVDRIEAKQQLGIAAERFVVSFGAMNLASQRKGASLLVESLSKINARENVACLSFGSGSLDESMITLPLHHAGYLSDNHQKRLALSAADVFVLPSLEDNLPLTGLEAMACGTPVIGFDSGGIPDYVIPGKTGWLAERGNTTQLSQCINAAAENREQTRVLGKNARELIAKSYSSNREASAYIELYQRLIAERQETGSFPERHAA